MRILSAILFCSLLMTPIAGKAQNDIDAKARDAAAAAAAPAATKAVPAIAHHGPAVPSRNALVEKISCHSPTRWKPARASQIWTASAARTPAPALVLSLHGADVEASGQAAAYAQKEWCSIVAPTNRRKFGFDWEDWGRIDAFEPMAAANTSGAGR